MKIGDTAKRVISTVFETVFEKIYIFYIFVITKDIQ